MTARILHDFASAFAPLDTLYKQSSLAEFEVYSFQESRRSSVSFCLQEERRTQLDDQLNILTSSDTKILDQHWSECCSCRPKHTIMATILDQTLDTLFLSAFNGERMCGVLGIAPVLPKGA